MTSLNGKGKFMETGIEVIYTIPANNSPLRVNNRNIKKKVPNLLKTNNKDTRTTLMPSF